MTPEELYKANENLVYFVLHKKFPQYAHDEDMQQVAKIALWCACKKFDAGKGFSISTFATRYIQNGILHELTTKNRMCRKQKDDEISLDAQCVENGYGTIGEIIPDKRAETDLENAEFDFGILKKYLSSREYEIVRLKYAELTNQKIALKFGVTPTRVYQILLSAGEKLKKGGII